LILPAIQKTRGRHKPAHAAKNPGCDTEGYDNRVSQGLAHATFRFSAEVLPRFVEISKDTFIPLAEVMAKHLDAPFPGMHIPTYDLFRVSRDAHFAVSD